MKRFEFLGCQLTQPLAKIVAALDRNFCGVGQHPADAHRQFMRQDDVWGALALATLCHLEYEVPTGVSKRMNDGVDVAIDYFFGDWWHNDPTWQPMLDKRHSDRSLVWFKSFSCGLLLAMLLNRWSDVEKLCSWIEADLQPEYLGNELEVQGCQVYISIAAKLRAEPMPGLEDLESRLRTCRPKRAKLLYRAWEAAQDGNQAGFDKAMKQSMELFDSTYTDAQTIVEWVAQHQSVVALAAQRLGMKPPTLPDRLAAMLLTPESLGMEPR
jgi:hypothetical protein